MCWWIYNNGCIEQHQRWEVRKYKCRFVFMYLYLLDMFLTAFSLPTLYNRGFSFMRLRGIIDYFLLCFVAPNLTNITRLISANQCGSGTADEARQNQTERETRADGRKGVLYLRRHFINPKCRHLTCMRLNIFLVCLQPVRTNPTDSTFRFNSVWITLIWGEVQLDLHRRGARN